MIYDPLIALIIIRNFFFHCPRKDCSMSADRDPNERNGFTALKMSQPLFSASQCRNMIKFSMKMKRQWVHSLFIIALFVIWEGCDAKWRDVWGKHRIMRLGMGNIKIEINRFMLKAANILKHSSSTHITFIREKFRHVDSRHSSSFTTNTGEALSRHLHSRSEKRETQRRATLLIGINFIVNKNKAWRSLL